VPQVPCQNSEHFQVIEYQAAQLYGPHMDTHATTVRSGRWRSAASIPHRSPILKADALMPMR
jgi:hypothetical protein